jgi:hypothetical protein
MGCDIHTMAEYETDQYAPGVNGAQGKFVPGGKWKAIKDQVFPYPYFHEDEPVSRFNEKLTSEPYTGRNYALFSLLADVRNTRSTGNMFDASMQYEERDSILPLAEPRGVPKNASKRWKRYAKRWGTNLHSESYFTLQELIDYEASGAFDQIITQRGYVSLSAYLAHKADGTEIEGWASYTSAKSMHDYEWEALSDDEKAPYLAASAGEGSRALFPGLSIRYKWTWTLRTALGGLIETMEALKVNAPRKVHPDLANLDWQARRTYDGPKWVYDCNRIRIVFGFDN